MPEMLLSPTLSDSITTTARTKSNKTLALDLDETLVHCKNYPFETPCVFTGLPIKNQVIELFIVKRPGMKKFLKKMSERYNLVLYTSALEEYAEAILEALKIGHYFSRVYHRKHCNLTHDRKFVKNLAITGVPLSDIVLLDDSDVHFRNQPKNVLKINAFRGNDPEDTELAKLTDFLLQLADEPDVRPALETFMSKRDFVRVLGREINPKPMPTLDSLSISLNEESDEDYDFLDLGGEVEEFIGCLPSSNHTNRSKLLLPRLEILQKVDPITNRDCQLQDNTDSEQCVTPTQIFSPRPVKRLD